MIWSSNSVLPRLQRAIEEQPCENTYSDICNYFPPNHIDINASEWGSDALSLLDCVPDTQDAEAQREAGSGAGELEVSDVAGHDEGDVKVG